MNVDLDSEAIRELLQDGEELAVSCQTLPCLNLSLYICPARPFCPFRP